MRRCQCGRLISHHKHMCLACMWQEAKRRTETMKIKPKEIKVCQKCGKEFFPKNSTRGIYCSDKCRKQATYQRQKARRKWGICMICGVEFEYSAINRRKRCDECTEADIRKPYKISQKRKRPPEGKCSSAAEKAARLARLPEGANPKDAWMEDIGAIQITPGITRTGAKAAMKISPAKLRPTILEPTREWKGKTPDEMRAQNIAEAKKKYRDNSQGEKKKRNCHPNDGYTPDEDDLILDMTNGGATLEEISEILGRSRDGLKYRLKKLRSENGM